MPLDSLPPAMPPSQHAIKSPYHHASAPQCFFPLVSSAPSVPCFSYPSSTSLSRIPPSDPRRHAVISPCLRHQSKRSSNPPPAGFCAAPLALALAFALTFAFVVVVVVGPQSLLMVCSCSKSLIVFPPVPAFGVGFGADPFLPIVERLVVQRSSNVDPLVGLACAWPGAGAAPGEVTDVVEV